MIYTNMKKNSYPRLSYPLILLIIFLWMAPLESFAQNVGINADGSLPNASAMLDVKSTNKGMLPPRMTTAQRTAIPLPAAGLLVFDTNTSSFWYYTGTSWSNLASGWSLTGNVGTNPATHFIGTTDDNPLIIKVNNQASGSIYISGFRTSWGFMALSNNTTGTYNTAIGTLALQNNSTGSANTGLGAFSLRSNLTGYANTAVGSEAMFLNTTGGNNTATGMGSLYFNTTGFDNTATGMQALYNNTTGASNTASGSEALFYNTTGTANTASGYQSLNLNTTGGNNTAMGFQSLYSNTTGIKNTASGFQAMYYNTTGVDNTATGSNALANNRIGNDNSSLGVFSLYSNTTGSGNTALGRQALVLSTTGNGNTALGNNAMTNNISGGSNVSAGELTLVSNTTGSANTAIGWNADVSTGNLINTTAIGFGVTVNASNKVRIGNSAVTVIEGQVPFTTPSDGRFKYAVKEDVKGLDFILQLRPVTYQFDVNKFDDQLRRETTNNHSSSIDSMLQASYIQASAIRRTGFIAQEVEQAAIKIGYDFSGIIKPQTANDHYSLSYESFVVPLVKAVQELSAKVDRLETENETLRMDKQAKTATEMEELKKSIHDLQLQVQELKKK
jgi:hypothetical protein